MMSYFSRMASSREIKLHAGFWVVFIGLDLLLERLWRGPSPYSTWMLLQNTGFTLLQMALFYLNYAWICPATIPKQRWWSFAMGQIGLLLLFPGLRFVIEEIVLFSITGAHNYVMDDLTPLYYIYDNSYYVIRILVLSAGFYGVKHLLTTDHQLGTLRLEKKKAELAALKNQLSPHFLFNTLNSFYSDLYDTQPKVAQDILTLSELLRYVTYENQEESVRLQDDLRFLEHYIALHARRFDGAIAVRCSFPDNTSDYRIPSLLLIHFVENAFKHGRLDDPTQPVTIRCSVTDDQLVFEVGNARTSGQHYQAQGIGQQNISQRLDLLFGEQYRLDIRESETRYDITLTLPLWKNAIT